jgi:hypothetical protein
MCASWPLSHQPWHQPGACRRLPCARPTCCVCARGHPAAPLLPPHTPSPPAGAARLQRPHLLQHPAGPHQLLVRTPLAPHPRAAASRAAAPAAAPARVGGLGGAGHHRRWHRHQHRQQQMVSLAAPPCRRRSPRLSAQPATRHSRGCQQQQRPPLLLPQQRTPWAQLHLQRGRPRAPAGRLLWPQALVLVARPRGRRPACPAARVLPPWVLQRLPAAAQTARRAGRALQRVHVQQQLLVLVLVRRCWRQRRCCPAAVRALALLPL